MNTLLIFSILLLGGLFFGEISKKLSLPKITGYLISGLVFSNLFGHIFTESFISNADVLVEFGLVFIAFEIGGHLSKSKLHTLGKMVFFLTIFESLGAFISVSMGIFIYFFFTKDITTTGALITYIATALLLGTMASPTDPATTLAISQENKTSGPVTTTILGITVLDDLVGIFLFIILFPISKLLISSSDQHIIDAFLSFFKIIFCSVSLGGLLGILISVLCPFLKKESDGILVIVLFGVLSLITGLSQILPIDTIISAFLLGFIVRNFSSSHATFFRLMSRYSEELIFLLFFSISGLHFKLNHMSSVLSLTVLFISLRALGKYIGIQIGGTIANVPQSIRKYLLGGLIPQGGVVIGLALLIKQAPELSDISNTLFSVILSTTIFHEIIGPLLTYVSLKKAKEIN